MPALALVCLFLLGGCGVRSIGYGVVLWSEDENSLKTGEIYPVIEKSKIRKTFIVYLSGMKKYMELDQWRMRFFEKRKEASLFREDYEPLVPIYALCARDGLPIRRLEDTQSEILYKLRENQQLKIIGKNPDSVAIAGMNDYWYLVMTGDGTEGYCFGGSLEIIDISQDIEKEELSEAERNMNEVLQKKFRHESFREMQKNDMIDLSLFSTRFGFFPDPENMRLKLNTPDYSIDFEYTGTTYIGHNRYKFDGTTLQMTIVTPDVILLHYPYNNREYGERYINIPNLNDLIIEEQERRDTLFSNIYERGRILASTAFGVINLNANGNFIWNDYGKLVPSVIPSAYSGEGVIKFGIFLSAELRSLYDGVISFHFSEDPKNPVGFLYVLDEKGIKLTHAPASIIENNIVTKENPAPIIIYFQFFRE